MKRINFQIIKDGIKLMIQKLLNLNRLVVIPFIFTVIFFLVIISITTVDLNSVDRTKLLADIGMAITNGAELQDIKQIFENRNHIRTNTIKDIFSNIFSSPDAEAKAIYKEPVSLSSVLKDLKAEIYLCKKEKVDKDLVWKIKRVLAEHEKSNPFDKLESSQRIHFETIQSKLGNGYSRIQQDVNFIVDELANKNLLVAKYLGDATLSFRISVIALFIGLLSIITQVVVWWRRKRKGGNSTT